MVKSGIYKITSKIKPDRLYIGSSLHLRKRKNEHFRELKNGIHKNNRLQKHCDKYSINDLEFEIIIECDISDLLMYEQFYIDALNPYFNISPTAGNTIGCKCSDETKKKISEKAKGRKVSEETRTRMSLAHKGSQRSEETKLKMSESAKGNTNAKGYIPSEETREKIRLKKLGNKDGFKKGHPYLGGGKRKKQAA